MIPIKDAIASNNWLRCEYTINDQLYQFRLKILSFQKLDLTEVDEPEKIFMWNNTSIWLMEVEILNLSKEPISAPKLFLIRVCL